MRNSRGAQTAVEADQDHLARALCPMSLSFGGRQCSHRYWLLPRCSTRGKLHNEFTRTPNACEPDVGSQSADTIKLNFRFRCVQERQTGARSAVHSQIDRAASVDWVVNPSRAAFGTRLNRVGDSQGHRIRVGMRCPSAHQHGVRTDSAGDGDQRQYKDDGQGSHGRKVARD